MNFQKDNILILIVNIVKGISREQWIDVIKEKNKNNFSDIIPAVEVTCNSLSFLQEKLSKIDYSSWIPMDIYIKQHIKNLVMNTLHGDNKEIVDPLCDSTLKAHMWIDLSLNVHNSNSLLIAFYNPLKEDCDINKTLNNAKFSKRIEKEHCNNLDITTDYEYDNNRSLLITKLIIPII